MRLCTNYLVQTIHVMVFSYISLIIIGISIIIHTILTYGDFKYDPYYHKKSFVGMKSPTDIQNVSTRYIRIKWIVNIRIGLALLDICRPLCSFELNSEGRPLVS